MKQKAIKIKSTKHGQKVKKEFVRLGIDVYDCKFNIFDYYYYSFNNLTHFSPSIPPGYEEITLKQLKKIGRELDQKPQTRLTKLDNVYQFNRELTDDEILMIENLLNQ